MALNRRRAMSAIWSLSEAKRTCRRHLARHDTDGASRRTVGDRAAVVYLASAASTYITGAILSIDGGYTAW
jgi:NAD(P)-dependent dehydrogenase (short-subunit alcohol dehydrogenase family)